MEKLLISACLLGSPSRYDGKSVIKINDAQIAALNESFQLIPFCPEIYGGLPTPRVPSESVDGRIITRDGRDVTENYLRGAREALRLCRMLGIRVALLKERSPSCGAGKIYDGSFSGTLTDGDGVTAKMLMDNGIAVYRESEINILLKR